MIALAASLETALNAWLKINNEARPRLAKLDEQVIQLEIIGLAINFYFLPNQTSIMVLSEYAGKADAIIQGSPISLMRLSFADDRGKALLESDIKLSGNIQVGQAFSQILAETGIDWDELLSQMVSEIVVYQAKQIIDDGQHWLKQEHSAIRANITKNLQKESGMLATEQEVADYMDAVDYFRMDVDRLEATLKRLQ